MLFSEANHIGIQFPIVSGEPIPLPKTAIKLTGRLEKHSSSSFIGSEIDDDAYPGNNYVADDEIVLPDSM